MTAEHKGRPSKFSFNQEASRTHAGEMLDYYKRLLKQVDEIPEDFQLQPLSELFEEVNTLIDDKFRKSRGFHRVRMSIAHRIAKMTRGTPVHEQAASGLRLVARDSFETIVAFDPLTAIEYSGIALTQSSKSSEARVNVGFCDWGLYAINRVIAIAKNSDLEAVGIKAKGMHQKISEEKYRIIEERNVQRSQQNTAG